MEQKLDLNESLKTATCPKCGQGYIRPVDIYDGAHLSFQCSNRQCRWSGRAGLPEIKKKIIYLDTSTVSHIVRAVIRNESQSPWVKLYERLRKAVAGDVLCCPGSTILENEAELSKYYDRIIEISRELGDPQLRSELDIYQAQLFRALKRYLASESPILETSPPREEAFWSNVNDWLPVLRVTVKSKMPVEWIESRRASKGSVRDEVEKIYRSYADEGLSFDQICEIESRGFGRAHAIEGVKSIRIRAGLEEAASEQDHLGHILPGIFDAIVIHLRQNHELALNEAIQKTSGFLLSDHVRLIPVADIGGKLNAALAMLCRGKFPRLPKPSDPYDVDHLATFLPYVDVLIADGFIADLCNQNHLLLGDVHGCEIRSLPPDGIPEFIDEIDRLVAAAPHADLSRTIRQAISDGGFHQEFAKSAAEFLKQKGIDLDK